MGNSTFPGLDTFNSSPAAAIDSQGCPPGSAGDSDLDSNRPYLSIAGQRARNNSGQTGQSVHSSPIHTPRQNR